MLTTETLVTDLPEKEKPAMPAGGGMGGMGGGMDY
jgi:chaperonin GroEL